MVFDSEDFLKIILGRLLKYPITVKLEDYVLASVPFIFILSRGKFFFFSTHLYSAYEHSSARRNIESRANCFNHLMMAGWPRLSILVSCMDLNFLSSLSTSKIYSLEEGAKTKSPKSQSLLLQSKECERTLRIIVPSEQHNALTFRVWWWPHSHWAKRGPVSSLIWTTIQHDRQGYWVGPALY